MPPRHPAVTGGLLATLRALAPLPFGQRPPLWSAEFPFLLLWSHKAASTALAQWFFAHIGSPQLRDGLPDAAARHAGLGIHAYQFGVYCKGPAYRFYCRRALASGGPVIKFVRDPAARAFSAFLATRRGVVLQRPDFWGARVSRQVLSWKGGQAVDASYSFADFVEWMAATPLERQNPHVRAQWMPFESGRPIERLPIEGLVDQLAALEQRFGLPPLSAQEGLLASGHHRPRVVRIGAESLEALLRSPVSPGAFDTQPAPLVDSAALMHTGLGARLRAVLAADYRASHFY
jgi:hypothetical protein